MNKAKAPPHHHAELIAEFYSHFDDYYPAARLADTWTLCSRRYGRWDIAWKPDRTYGLFLKGDWDTGQRAVPAVISKGISLARLPTCSIIAPLREDPGDVPIWRFGTHSGALRIYRNVSAGDEFRAGAIKGGLAFAEEKQARAWVDYILGNTGGEYLYDGQ